MNATKTILKALVKTVLCVAVVAGTLTFATGCDDLMGRGYQSPPPQLPLPSRL